MAHAGNFENYLKDSVLDLSSIENNRETTPKLKVENVIAFSGSKMWLDIQLDATYFFLSSSQATCNNFCYNTNFKQHIESLKNDAGRQEALACQMNCLNKLTGAAELLNSTVKNHPRKIKHVQEFNKINQDVKSFNEDYLNKKKDYSF